MTGTKTFRIKISSGQKEIKTSFRVHGNLATTQEQEAAIHNFILAVCGGFMEESKIREWADVHNFKTGLPK
jgi:hypothetical protein